MVTKIRKPSATRSDAQASGEVDAGAVPASVKDSAQQIWQAGLGAFTRAQAEGTKAFEALVKEGIAMQRKTQAVAEERLNEATTRMTSMAQDLSSKASGPWDRLESIFEDRVAKALNKLGMPAVQDVHRLIARIEALEQKVQALSDPGPPAPAARKSSPRAKAPGTARARSSSAS